VHKSDLLGKRRVRDGIREQPGAQAVEVRGPSHGLLQHRWRSPGEGGGQGGISRKILQQKGRDRLAVEREDRLGRGVAG